VREDVVGGDLLEEVDGVAHGDHQGVGPVGAEGPGPGGGWGEAEGGVIGCK